MYVFKTAKFADLTDIMEGTALSVLQEVQATGRVDAFERYAQEYLDQMGGATFRTLKMWIVNNMGKILFGPDVAA